MWIEENVPHIMGPSQNLRLLNVPPKENDSSKYKSECPRNLEAFPARCPITSETFTSQSYQKWLKGARRIVQEHLSI